MHSKTQSVLKVARDEQESLNAAATAVVKVRNVAMSI
jgi:hypothetical protein